MEDDGAETVRSLRYRGMIEHYNPSIRKGRDGNQPGSPGKEKNTEAGKNQGNRMQPKKRDI